MSTGNINSKLKFKIIDLSDNFSFLLSAKGGVHPLCAPGYPRLPSPSPQNKQTNKQKTPTTTKKKTIESPAYRKFPNFGSIHFLYNFGFSIIRLFSFLELSNNKESKGRNVCIFWKKWFFENIRFSFIFFKGCFYFSSIYCLYYAKNDTANMSLFLPPPPQVLFYHSGISW